MNNVVYNDVTKTASVFAVTLLAMDSLCLFIIDLRLGRFSEYWPSLVFSWQHHHCPFLNIMCTAAWEMKMWMCSYYCCLVIILEVFLTFFMLPLSITPRSSCHFFLGLFLRYGCYSFLLYWFLVFESLLEPFLWLVLGFILQICLLCKTFASLQYSSWIVTYFLCTY